MYAERVRSLAFAAARLAAWTMPPWVAVDLTVWNSRLDRDNAAKPAMDAMQGIVFAFDSRVIDGAIAKRWDGGGERIEVTAREVNPLDYGRTG